MLSETPTEQVTNKAGAATETCLRGDTCKKTHTGSVPIVGTQMHVAKNDFNQYASLFTGGLGSNPAGYCCLFFKEENKPTDVDL